jgi:hypothetical protein
VRRGELSVLSDRHLDAALRRIAAALETPLRTI